MKYDVVVFGGGLAGVSSAVNAKRLGKKVLLVEQGATIGGLATQGLVNPFMRFWLDGQILAGEFFQELLRDLDIFGGKFENSFDSEILKIILFIPHSFAAKTMAFFLFSFQAFLLKAVTIFSCLYVRIQK